MVPIRYGTLLSKVPSQLWFNSHLFPIGLIGARTLKGGPELLEKEIHEILGSKREDQFSDLVFEVVQNTTLVRFSYLLRLRNLREMPKFPHKCQKIAGC